MSDVDFGEWRYQARVTNIVDGDTIDVDLDLGFSIVNHDQRLRLLDINTAETYGVSHDSDEFALGMNHAGFVHDWVNAARSDDEEWPLIVETERDQTGKYGRWLAYVRRKSDGQLLHNALIEEFGDDVATD